MEIPRAFNELLIRGKVPMVAGDQVDQIPVAGGLPLWAPSEGKIVSEIQSGDKHTVDFAIKAALDAEAKEHWPHPPRDRAKLMLKLCQLIERDAEVLAQLDSLTAGLTLARARDSVSAIIEDFEYYSGWCTKIEGKQIPVSNKNAFCITKPEPSGICCGIYSWNWPIEAFASKVAPALAAGNRLILKPAEQAAPSSTWLARLVLEAGFPAGVLSVIHGSGPVVGQALACHNAIDAVSFTGATETGLKLASLPGIGTKKIGLQLSGTCYSVVFRDADIELAVDRLVMAAFDHSGQNCIAPSKVFVHKKIYDQFISLAAKKVSSFRVGDPTNPSSNAGPLISSTAKKRINDLLKDASKKGAAISANGKIDPSANENGFYVIPTMIQDCPSSSPLYFDEIYGPIMNLIPFSSAEDLSQKTKVFKSTLAVGLWTQNIGTAQNHADTIRSGTVWINGYGVYDSAMPTGGWGRGGLGRELGGEALQLYIRHKSVWHLGG